MFFNVPVTEQGIKPKMLFLSMGLRVGQVLDLYDKRSQKIGSMVIEKGFANMPRDISAVFKGCIPIISPQKLS